MEKTKEFDKTWKKTCPTCTSNPSNILYYKKQCSACEDKDAKSKIYTKEDMLKLWNTLMVAMTNKNPIFFKDFINSLNKQD